MIVARGGNLASDGDAESLNSATARLSANVFGG